MGELTLSEDEAVMLRHSTLNPNAKPHGKCRTVKSLLQRGLAEKRKFRRGNKTYQTIHVTPAGREALVKMQRIEL